MDILLNAKPLLCKDCRETTSTPIAYHSWGGVSVSLRGSLSCVNTFLNSIVSNINSVFMSIIIGDTTAKVMFSLRGTDEETNNPDLYWS